MNREGKELGKKNGKKADDAIWNYHIGFSQQVKQENDKTLNLGFVMHTAQSNSIS